LNTFTWLLLGHLVGDWLLQNDWMARGKRTRMVTLPGAVHVAVYTAAVTVALWLSSTVATAAEMLGAGAVIAVTHWLIDSGNGAERWMRFFGQSRLESVRVAVDQVLHLLVLGLIAWSVAGRG
jgi:hypothetical protein